MNMRKIVAIMAAVMMLFSVIPMAAVSVSADGSFNFEDGTVGGWLSGCNIEVVDDNGSKVLKWDASGADWANVYYYGSAIVAANKDYVVSFRVKADRNTNINFKVNNNWAGDTATKTFDVSTEWQEYSEVINSGACTNGALLLFSSNTTKADGATYYLDDISFVEYIEPVEPGTVINGDFETGDLSGWAKHQSTTISTDAHSGSYAANLKGDGGWGGMLNQDVPVEAGKTYKVSVWYKVNSNGTNIQIKDGGTEGAKLASNWVTAATWTEQTWEVIPTTDIICFNFCGGGNGIAEDVLIDDITVTEVKDPSFDGYIYNGDFETGKNDFWSLHQSTVISADAAHTGDYGVHIVGVGNWGGLLEQDISGLVVGKKYLFSFWMKMNHQGVNVKIGDTYLGWYTAVGDWTLITKEFTATATTAKILINGGGDGNADPSIAADLYVDDFSVVELKEPSFDGYITNGDFETGSATPWHTYGTESGAFAEAAHSGNFGLKMVSSGDWGGTGDQNFTTEPGKTYQITLWIKTLENGVNIQIQDNGTVMAGGWINNAPEWTELTYEYTATSASGKINFCGGGNNLHTIVYVDDIKVEELKDPSFDGYITNGDFETGDVYPWDNLWGSCPTVEIVEGMDDGYGLHIVSKKWSHVRQTNIAVEANTWYKVTVWAKDTNNMHILVKDGGDSVNLLNKNFSAGEEWTEISYVFNSGDYTTVIFSLMGGDLDKDGERYGTFDNISIEKHEYVVETVDPTCDEDGYTTYTCSTCDDIHTEKIPAAHTYDNNCDFDCNICTEYRDAPHNLTTYVEAVVPANCQEEGHDEYWVCADCGGAFMSNGMGGYYETNPAWMNYTGDHVRPEGSAPCAVVACELCGEDDYGEPCTRPEGVPECTDAECVNCGETIYGWGHNYNTGDEETPLPLCGEGDCIYCGEHFDKLYDHESGAWAPCLDGECSYGCGLAFPAAEEHIDETADGLCDVCWSEMPVAEIVYGDVNGDGEIALMDAILLQQYVGGFDVTLDEAAADVNCDGEIALMDAILLQQYVGGFDVTLGPV